jgi:hypothetical protein
MRRPLSGITAALLCTAPAWAGGIELSGFAGLSLPTYSQTFRYNPGPIALPIPGLSVTQGGVFTVEGGQGFAAAGSAAWHFAGPLGIEARLDLIEPELSVSGARYDVVAQLPPPLPPISATIDLESGTAQFERLKPLSLNLRLRTDGPVRLHLSGGLSYLPDLEASIVQRVGLGVTGLLPGGQLEVATLGIKAVAVPTQGGDEGKLGANAGVGIAVGGTLSVVAEGRIFVFKERRIQWSAAGTPASALEAQLLEQVLQRLPEVEFNPTTFQALLGLSLRF